MQVHKPHPSSDWPSLLERQIAGRTCSCVLQTIHQRQTPPEAPPPPSFSFPFSTTVRDGQCLCHTMLHLFYKQRRCWQTFLLHSFCCRVRPAIANLTCSTTGPSALLSLLFTLSVQTAPQHPPNLHFPHSLTPHVQAAALTRAFCM